MAFEVIMPKAGMAMEEGTLVQWLKTEGDFVEAGESLLEIMTDKVNMEIEAEHSGILMKIQGEEGEVYPVFTVLAYVGSEEEFQEFQEEREEPSSSSRKTPSGAKWGHEEASGEESRSSSRENPSSEDPPRNAGEKVRATPAARREAFRQQLDLTSIQGTGPLGRIQERDVKEALLFAEIRENPVSLQPRQGKPHCQTPLSIQGNLWTTPVQELFAGEQERTVLEQGSQGENSWEKPSSGSFFGSGFSPTPGQEASGGRPGNVQKKPRFFFAEEDAMEKTQRIPLTGIRRAIASRMKESYLTSPMYSLTMEVDMSRVKQMLEELKEPMLEERGIRLTITDFIIKAATKALKQFPTLNASMEQEHIVLHHGVHIALAVGLENGLMVPVIHDADKKSLAEIAAQSKDLALRARAGKLKPFEHEGSTFTISNLGVYDIESFTAIINQPNSALLGVGAVIDKAVPRNGEIVVLPMMKLIANIDHRVTDGATGAQFLQHLRDLLEKPSVIFELT